jgi:hypothetical protein
MGGYMGGKFSRDKGQRSELEITHFLGSNFQKTSQAGVACPDVSSDWAVISVKNHAKPISLHECLDEIKILEAQAPGKQRFVAVKVDHKWLVVQRAEQFREYRC